MRAGTLNIVRDAPLAPLTWFRTGGGADMLFKPASAAELADTLRALPADVPVWTLGMGSNVIVRDGGVRGMVVKLARGFRDVVVDGEGVIAGAGALDATVADHAHAASLSGLEFMVGIPGSVGGGVAMNAGCYGREFSDVVDWAECVRPDGEAVRLGADDLGFAYRESRLPGIVTLVRLRAMPGEPGAVAARMAVIREERARTQPRAMTGGSTFRNPPDARAWRLIEAAGCRGMTLGGARVSDKHCNFMINTGNATSADIEALGEVVRARVFEHSGIRLQWEVLRVGEA